MKKGAASFKEELEDDIATGRLAPGARLDEASLATRFGVSRTPVREVLLQLAAQGLVELRPYRGAVVSSPDPRSLMEMFEVMAELEAMCGRLAAQRLDDESEKKLLETLQACAEAAENGDPDSYYYENERFHRAIYQASENSFLADQALNLHKRLAPFRRLQLRVRNRLHVSQSEHERIVVAIRAGDPEQAADALRAHVVVQGEKFTYLIASLDCNTRKSA
ncbi:MAG TPA: GntR family transcriptional regulator [Hyphomicrobiaceae bacterium]|nr:GntR family transcriptional regulator [Hyphomicrobiaceae bacterium]